MRKILIALSILLSLELQADSSEIDIDEAAISAQRSVFCADSQFSMCVGISFKECGNLVSRSMQGCGMKGLYDALENAENTTDAKVEKARNEYGSCVSNNILGQLKVSEEKFSSCVESVYSQFKQQLIKQRGVKHPNT